MAEQSRGDDDLDAAKGCFAVGLMVVGSVCIGFGFHDMGWPWGFGAILGIVVGLVLVKIVTMIRW